MLYKENKVRFVGNTSQLRILIIIPELCWLHVIMQEFKPSFNHDLAI